MQQASEEIRLEQALSLHREGRLADAAQLYRSLLAGRLAVEARLNLGAALDEGGSPAQAVSCYREALAAAPQHPHLHYNLGNALMKLGHFREAVGHYRSACAGEPSRLEPLLGLGAALQADGDLLRALVALQQAVSLEPDCAEAHWYLALALLQAGELAAGWQEYEWRWKKRSFTSPPRSFREPEWDGSPLQGRTILLHAEQGLGDTLQFIRYAPLVAERGGTVLVECQSPSLKPLLERVTGVSQVTALGAELPPFEVQLPLLSLPRVFGTTLDQVPGQTPYLLADAGRLAEWRDRVGGDPFFKVGMVWAGKKFPDPFRSCPGSELAPLAELPCVSFYSLQLGEAEALPQDFPLNDLTSYIKDFDDTAALITLMDLVVTVDTSVAHLAGALGKPTLIMLPKACDWRWLSGRGDSPWYPSMRLFRQEEQGDWRPVLRELAGHLGGLLWEFLQQGAARQPFSGDWAYRCGEFLAQQGRDPEACARFGKAAALKQGCWEPLYSQGVSLQRQGRLAEAEMSFREAAALAPAVTLIHEALGVTLQQRGKLQDAIGAYRRALELDPGLVRCRYNLGCACKEAGLFGEALAAFREVVAAAPDYADARWNLALLLLMHGELPEGWRDFAWRFRKSTGAVQGRWRNHPAWQGEEFTGKTLLLHGEQGLGDTLQLLRYLPLVARRGGEVVLEVQCASLVRLAQCVAGVTRVVVQGEEVPSFGLQASLMDLPSIFRTDLESIPAAPYLTARPALVQLWRSRLAQDRSLRVGLVWSGNARHENDARRSLALTALEPLASLPGVSFHSLQLGSGADQAAQGGALKLQDFTSRIADFADTAAYVMNLHLVISVDTAVVHLCGALGVPVWVLTPFVPDWRWMLEREDSPWYPSVRLFRQHEEGDWAGVVERVRERLAEAAAQHGAQRTGFLKERGMKLSAEGRHEEAAQTFEAVLAENPHDPEAYNNLGSELDTQGKHQEAVARYLRAIALKRDFAAPHYNMGNSLRNLGRTQEAVACYRRAVELEPELIQGWHNLGLALQEQCRYQEALQALERALDIDPAYHAALHNLGEVHQAKGDVEKARECFRSVLERDPSYLPSWNALGLTLHSEGRLEEAAACYQRALSVKEDYLHALNNLGGALKGLGKVQEAEGCYRTLLAISPDYADAHWNLALVLLLMGRFEEGWRRYEWRFEKEEPIVRRALPQPVWDGAPLRGRTILLHAEQGFGDAIQFVRYATLLAQDAQVLVECQTPQLKPLFATVPGVRRVVARGEELPPFEVHAPLMSLPHLCGTSLESIPGQTPYLSCDPQRVELWREKVARDGLRVGMVWAGRKTYKDDKKRSLSLDLFAPLAQVPGVRFYSLQMGSGVEQLEHPPSGMEISDLTGAINDFADSAALVSQLDLVISADTAVAHLTGALGKPVWVLLPFANDWRWLQEREDSPWYPSARLFRQEAPGDWPGVMQRVAQALREKVEEKGQ